MDSSESISYSMDTTTDSIDVVGHFKCDPKKLMNRHHNCSVKNQSPIFKKKRQQKRPQAILLNNSNLDYQDEDTISNKLPPDKEYCIVDETPPSSTSSSTTTINDCSPSQQQLSQNNNQHLEITPTSSASSSLATFMSCCGEASSSSEATLEKQCEAKSRSTRNNPSKGRKSVLFDKVTVYHFNRSQGFTSVPSQGGATLGMKRKHFLRRRLSVDLYEEVRRRSRRQILLKIHIEKKKREERNLQQQQLDQQKSQSNRLKQGSSSSSQASTPDLDGNPGNQSNSEDCTVGGEVKDDSDTKLIDVVSIGESNDEEDDDDDETYSDYSDISDSELESDSYIFLQPLDVKLRRSLLRASGVCRIDPLEKKECKRIRDSRERSGCKCVGQCIPEYCECSRLGVKCHVDRVSFPCGCSSDGCKNPEGRTEFDIGRVRRHFEEKIMESHSQMSSNEDELTATTPPSSTTSEESF
jgi:hypothetical protein